MTTDMLGWNETTAITVLGIAFAVAGVYSIFLYAIMGYSARKYITKKTKQETESNEKLMNSTELENGPYCSLEWFWFP